MATKTLRMSFIGGEISPRMFGKVDDVHYVHGVAAARNMQIEPQGPAANRAGFRFVHEAGNSAKRVNVLPFRISQARSLLLEFGGLPPDGFGGLVYTETGYIRVFENGQPLIVAPRAFQPFHAVTFAIGSSSITWAGNTLAVGDPVVFQPAVPANFTVGIVYYVVGLPVPGVDIQVSSTPGGAPIVAAGNAVGGGYRRYYNGELVTNAGNPYWCRTQNDSVNPTPATFVEWYEMPSDGTLEIPTFYTEDQFFELNWTQSLDVMSIAHRNSPFYELRHYGDDTRWSFQPRALSAPIIAPTGLATTTIFRGIGIHVGLVTAGAAPAGSVFDVTGNQPHHFQDGDLIWAQGFTVIADGWYIVKDANPATSGLGVYQFRLDNYTDRSLATVAGEVPAATALVFFVGPEDAAVLADNKYVVTSIDVDGNESLPTATPLTVTNVLAVPGAYNEIQWNAVSLAVQFRVYKQEGGQALYGFIGTADASFGHFRDDNIAPDLGITPPREDTLELQTADNYPGAITYFEQRRLFGGTNTEPRTVWGTRSNTEADLSYHLPLLDDDRLKFQIAAREASTVRHLIPLGELLVLTSDAEWHIAPINSDVLVPGAIAARAQSYIGSALVPPVVTSTAVFFVANRGGHLYELAFEWEKQAFSPRDRSLRAAHLFDRFDLVSLSFSRAPHPVLWAVSTSGQLLGLTYVPDEEVRAWHRHDTPDGVIEAVCAIPEGENDSVYVVVRRSLPGGDLRYIERMLPHEPEETALEDCVFLDSSVVQSGAPSTTVSGLDHLEGVTEVYVLADGAVVGPLTVTGGVVTLPSPASKKVAGLQPVFELQLPPILTQAEALGLGGVKNLNNVWVRMHRSAAAGVRIGPLREGGPFDDDLSTLDSGLDPEELFTRMFDATLLGDWNHDGSTVIRQTLPLPMAVISLVAEAELGG